MIGSFNFNGIESSSFKLVCKSVKRPLLPAIKVKRVDVTGLSGVFDFPNNEYSLRPVTMSITYIGEDYLELRRRARDIAAWLSVDGWSKLIINDENDKYYLSKVTENIDLESLWESGSAEVVFDCQPFAYSINEQVISFSATTLTNCSFINLGTRVINNKSPIGSKYIIRITGSWTSINLVSNTNTLTFNKAGSGTLIIDNVNMEVLLNNINAFKDLFGDTDSFLKIISGINNFTITGTNLNVIVNIEYIPLWL